MVSVCHVRCQTVSCVLCLTMRYVINVILVSRPHKTAEYALRCQIVLILLLLAFVVCLRCIMSLSVRHVLLMVVFCVNLMIHSCVKCVTLIMPSAKTQLNASSMIALCRAVISVMPLIPSNALTVALGS